MALTKKGFFYFVELMIIVILLAIIWSQFPTVQKTYIDLQERENLRQYGFSMMKVLDDTGVLSVYVNTTNFASTNFTALRAYAQTGFPKTTKIQLEYIVNSTTCFNQSGGMSLIGGCGLNETHRQNAASVFYTFSNSTRPITIRLQMVTLLGGKLGK